MVQFEVFQEQQQDGGDGLHDDLFVSIDIDAEFHALQHRGPARESPWLSAWCQAGLMSRYGP